MSMKEKFREYGFYAACTAYVALIGSVVVSAIYMLMTYGN